MRAVSLAALLLLLPVLGRAAQIPDALAPESTGLSSDALLEIGRLEAALDASPTARRLVAETDGFPMRAQSLGAEPIAYRFGAKPFLAFDERGLSRLDSAAAELLLARELAKAAAGWPLDCPEARAQARARRAEVALELARSDKAFGRRLKALAKAGRNGPPLADTALDLAALAQGPESFLWAVDGSFPSDQGPTLRTVEDFVAARGPSLERASFGPGGHYAWLDGRPYPAALARAARDLVESGARQRLDAALASFYSPELPELSERAAHWLGR